MSDQNPTKAPKPTKAEREFRITEIYKLLLMRVPRHDILRYCAEKTTWNLKERAIQYLITAATARFEEQAVIIRDQQFGKAVASIEDVYARSHRISDYKTCLAAQRELNELLGLYAPKQIKVEGDGGATRYLVMMPEPATSIEEWEACKRRELNGPPAPKTP
jgi:hypothetical protein